MAFSKLIAFDRPLSGAIMPGQGRMFTESEVAEKMQEAYRKGGDDARGAADQQMVEFRHDMVQLSDGMMKKVSELEPALLAQLREALPALAVEIGRRLLAGFEPSAEVVGQLCHEALEHLYPEREGLELSLNSRDAALLESLNPDWLKRYPGLRIRPDAALAPGDCQVRSRFGLTDARHETKLAVLAHHLTGA